MISNHIEKCCYLKPQPAYSLQVSRHISVIFSMCTAKSVGHNTSNMEHKHRHRKIRGKMVLLLVLTLLLLPLAESRSVRGCEEEFSAKRQTDKEKMQNSTSKEEQEDLLTFTLLHVNDIHSHFEEVNVNTGTCKVKLSSSLLIVRLPNPLLT